MNQTELEAQLILWRDKKKELDELEQTIKAAVMEGEKTIDHKNVRASYSGGRTTYRYNEAAHKAPMSVVEEHIKVKTWVDWKSVCNQLGIVDIPFSKSDPKVTLKFKFM